MAEATTARGDRAEGLLGSLFVLVVLGAILSTAIALLGLKIQRSDANQLADELLPADVELPLGFVRAGGFAVANEQRWVRYVLGPDGATEQDGRPLPTAVALGRFESFLAVKRQFEVHGLHTGEDLGRRVEEWLEEPEEQFVGLIGRGTVPIGPDGCYETDYLELREYGDDGHFTDRVRVNLTTGRETAQLLDAQWPQDVEGADVELLAPFLALLDLEPEPAPEGE